MIKVKPRLNYVPGREMFDRPSGVMECGQEIDGAFRTWKEYIPSSYDGTRPVPMVLTLHGGRSGKGQNNHRADLSTAWAAVAEREGFIVLYPQSLTREWAWSAWEDFSDKERTAGIKDDLIYMDELIELMQKKYCIDPTRIYLHGQSFGDVTAVYYLVNRPNHKFAAAATLSGPVGATRYFDRNGNCLVDKGCAVPIVRTHGSMDLSMPMGNYQHLEEEIPTYDHMKAMKAEGATMEEIQLTKLEMHQIPSLELWKYLNDCEDLPEISVRGRYNAMTFHGTNDTHFYMVEGGGHGPSMDMADFIWTFFFSGYQKVDGSYVKNEPNEKFIADRGAVALAEGAVEAYVDQKLVALSGRVIVNEGIYYVPAKVIEELYPKLTVTLDDENLTACITDGTSTMQVSGNNCTYVWNNHFQHGDRTYSDGQELMVPVRQVADRFFGQVENKGHGICYLSAHQGQITFDFGYFVRQLLGVQEVKSIREMWAKENAILAAAPQPGK